LRLTRRGEACRSWLGLHGRPCNPAGGNRVNSGLFSLAREHPAVVGVSGTFVRSMEQARLRVYLTLIALDMSSIFVGYVIAGEIRTGYLVHAQSFRLIAVMVPTFLGVALNNGAYSIAALERPGNGIAKACEALFFSLAGVIAILFYLKVSADFLR